MVDQGEQPILVSSIVTTIHQHPQDASLPRNDGQNDDYILPRLVTPHPWLGDDVSVEAYVERTVQSRYRVVIRNLHDADGLAASLPRSSSLVHASFLLPEQTQFPLKQQYDGGGVGGLLESPPSLMAWTHFAQPLDDEDNEKPEITKPPSSSSRKRTIIKETPKSTYLCVLVHPTLLSIYNVYPQQDSSSAEWTVQQEGWTVPLPLECGFVFAIPRTGGLLLQRLADPSELDQVLLEPPPNTQTASAGGGLTIDPNDGENSGGVNKNNNNSNAFAAVPALFYLRHYQQDVTPLAQADASIFWNDPLERVLWVGELVEYEDTTNAGTILLVTHHSKWQRHAIWSLAKAPPPPRPPTLPMYYAARHNYHPSSTTATTLPPAFLWDEQEEQGDFLGHPPDLSLASTGHLKPPQPSRRSFMGGPPGVGAATGDFITRQDALAEALGATTNHRHHKTPRHSLASSTSSRAPPTFFSPNPTIIRHGPAAAISAVNDGGGGMTEHSVHSFPAAPQQHAFLNGRNFFSTIHSHFATHRLYQEKNRSSHWPALRVFLISNRQATGLNVLAWLVQDSATTTKAPRRGHRAAPLPRGENLDQKRLCLFHMTSTSSKARNPSVSFHGDPNQRMEPLEDGNSQQTTSPGILCLDAQPIQSTPMLRPAEKCGGKQRQLAATDLLVLQVDGRLMIYRTLTPVAPLFVSEASKTLGKMMTGSLIDPVSHRVGWTMVGTDGEESHRFSVSLKLPCPFAEQALCAIQSSLEQSAEWADMAFMFRVDVVRAYQRLLKQRQHHFTGMSLAYKALSAVVLALVKWDLVLDDQGRNSATAGSQTTAWEALQASEYGLDHDIFPCRQPTVHRPSFSVFHQTYSGSNPQLLRYQKQEHKLRGTLTCHIFDPLHLLFEDSKLCNKGCPPDLPSLLNEICQIVPRSELQRAFFRHYQYSSLEAVENLASKISEMVAEPESPAVFTTFKEPPCIMRWVEDVFCKQKSRSIFESISPRCINPACYHIRFVRRALPLLAHSDVVDGAAASVVQLLVDEGFRDRLSVSEVFVPGVTFPLFSLLNKLTNDASEKMLAGLSQECFALIGRNDLSLNIGHHKSTHFSLPTPPSAPTKTDSVDSPNGGIFSDEDNDGLAPMEISSSMLFPDNRIHEAARLLRSSRPIFLRVPRVVEVTDHEYEQLKQRRLALLVRRALALPLGRGMVTLGSLKPLAAESLPIPQLCLKGRVPPTNATLSLDQQECPPELKVWPEFHNGVAAGLRLPLHNDADDRSSHVTRTWILFNKPPRSEMPNPEDGTSNANPAVLNNPRIHSHGGFLLALGLRGHLKALGMTDIYEYLTQGTVTVTVGVLLGMAANKRGSCDMSVSKMLCLHIPSLIPQHFSAIDVASAVQAAAVTGVGLLYQGSSHRMMTEFLLNEIGKKPESDTSAFDREAYTLSCGIALGMVNLCIGEKSGHVDRAAGISDLRIEERLRRYINGGRSNEEEIRRIQETNDRFSIPSSSNGVENEKCSIIFEVQMVNTDVTAPAATLALGLMYMKSGNQTVASAVSIPQTHFLLEFVRPDFLGLRVIAKSVILWDTVQPTQEWIESQVPDVVRSAYQSMRSIARKAMEGHTTSKSQRAVDYDRRAVRQIYVNIIAGACFSVGLRFAGTGDERAKKALFDCVLQMHKLREGNDPVSVVSKPEFPILETCLGLTALSLAMVLAGTGDLDALRLFKVLRWRDKDVVYGSHMVYGAAIGLLFFGGGTMTLGREPEDIAGLIAAFFPRFPSESMDNQYHLQALRHLYALAAKKSELCAIDVDTGERVYVPVQTLTGTKLLSMRAPCLLRNTDQPFGPVKVVSDEFYPMQFQMHPGSNIFYVKRRQATESYVNASSLGIGVLPIQLLSRFEYVSLNAADESFMGKVICREKSTDRHDIVLLFLRLITNLNKLERYSSGSINLMWDLRLIRSFSENNVPQSGVRKQQVPRESELLAFLLEKAYQQLVRLGQKKGDTEKNLLVSILYK